MKKRKMTYREFFRTLRKASRKKKFQLIESANTVKLKSGKRRKCWLAFHSLPSMGLTNPFSVVWEYVHPKEMCRVISSEDALDLLPKAKAMKLLAAWRHHKGYSKPLRERLLRACRIKE